jgi:hypothetical protein
VSVAGKQHIRKQRLSLLSTLMETANRAVLRFATRVAEFTALALMAAYIALTIYVAIFL